MEASFLHLLTLNGKPLANRPPAVTRAKKLAYLAARTRDEEMTPPSADDYRCARNEQMKASKSEYA